MIRGLTSIFGKSSKRRMTSLEACNTIIKCGDSRGTRGCLLRRDLRQKMQVSFKCSDSISFSKCACFFQSYVPGIGPSPHSRPLAIHFLWLSMLTIHTWLWETNLTQSGMISFSHWHIIGFNGSSQRMGLDSQEEAEPVLQR